MVTRRLAKPRPVQGEAGSDDAARRGTGYAARAAGQPAAERVGHPRQNPAYRPATGKALVTGLFLWTRFAGDSSGSPPRRAGCGPRGIARRAPRGCAGYEPLREAGSTRRELSVSEALDFCGHEQQRTMVQACEATAMDISSRVRVELVEPRPDSRDPMPPAVGEKSAPTSPRYGRAVTAWRKQRSAAPDELGAKT